MQLFYVSRHGTDHWLVEAVRQMGHVVEVETWGPESAARAAEDGYDLILADVGAPDPAAVAELQAEAPLVVLADEASPRQRAALLRAGADACLVRPFHLIEVQTRLMALVRLSDRQRASAAASAGLSLDRAQRRLALGDREAALSPAEFRLMTFLLRREGQVVDVATLDRHLSGEEAEARPDRVRGLVARLRAKLLRELGDPVVHGVRGHGYVLRMGPEAAD